MGVLGGDDNFFPSLDLEDKVDLKGNGDDRGRLRKEAALDELGKLDEDLAGERRVEEEVMVAGATPAADRNPKKSYEDQREVVVLPRKGGRNKKSSTPTLLSKRAIGLNKRD